MSADHASSPPSGGEAQPRTAQTGGDTLDRALELHRAGRHRDALALYDQILVRQPSDVRALTYGGVALLELGQAKRAVAALQRAVELQPDFGEAHCFLANALQTRGRFGDAEASYRQALAIAPGDARTHNNLGLVLHKLERSDEAVASFRQAIALQPHYAEAHNNLCHVLTKLGEIDDAVAAGRRAVEIDPDYAEAHNNYGNALVEAGRVEDAIAAYRKALAIRPKFVGGLNNLGIALIQGRRAREAVDVLDACLDIDPGNIQALSAKAVALSEAGEREALRALVDYDLLLREVRIEPGPDFAGLAEFNEALARHVCAHPSLASDPGKHATRQGMHSGSLLAEPKGPVAELERLIGDAFDGYLQALPSDSRNPFLAKKPARWQLDVWGIVLGSQGHQIPHMHPAGWLSGCYYVKVPRVVASGSEHEGWIEFGRPHERYRATAEPDLKLVRPEEGLMVLFPSFVFHRTVPFEAADKRISIAFDVRPVG